MVSPVNGRISTAACRAEFQSALGKFDQRPKLVVDYDQTVIWCCEDTVRILRSPMPLCVRQGRLVIYDEDLRSDFVDFLHNVGPEVQRKLIRGRAERHWAVVRAWRPAGWEGVVCVLCTPSLPLRDVSESGLATDLKLTNAEARVLKEFSELSSPKQIAVALGVSLSTVRSHLKTIHAKASVSSSAQLLRLAHTYCSG
jgi:DNA-binding CsgD family transcriptional regulator